MSHRSFRLILIVLFILYWGVPTYAKVINPLQYGIKDAKTGEERYMSLMRCHQHAIMLSSDISYQGIDTIRLSIPPNATSIPLTDNVDFAGVTLIVENRAKDICLFEKSNKLNQINNNNNNDLSGDYRAFKELYNGLYVVIIEDKEPWSRRDGYSYSFYRKDLVLVKNGKAKAKTITNYNFSTCRIQFWYRKVSPTRKVIKDLEFIRTDNSLFKTYCIKIENEYNIRLDNISITTPGVTNLTADVAIQLQNCFAVELKNITINGTYSKEHEYGYGVYIDNVNTLKVDKMYGHAKWGVFGSNNLNNVVLSRCDINRFDIHCYGRDIRAVNCIFSGLYNQYSSVFGFVKYEKCVFTDFIPVLVESSYNAYTPFDLFMNHCTFHLDGEKNYLITLFGVPAEYNKRPELKRKSLPNITIKNCRVFLSDDVREWYLINTRGNAYKDTFDYLSNISMSGITVSGNNQFEFQLYSEMIKTTLPLKTKIDIKAK